jgi:hypothetical protein
MPEASEASEAPSSGPRLVASAMATEAEREAVRRPVMLTIADRALIHDVLHRAFNAEEPLYAIIHVLDAVEASICPQCSGTGVLSPPPGADDLDPCGLCAGTGWRASSEHLGPIAYISPQEAAG